MGEHLQQPQHPSWIPKVTAAVATAGGATSRLVPCWSQLAGLEQGLAALGGQSLLLPRAPCMLAAWLYLPVSKHPQPCLPSCLWLHSCLQGPCVSFYRSPQFHSCDSPSWHILSPGTLGTWHGGSTGRATAKPTASGCFVSP